MPKRDIPVKALRRGKSIIVGVNPTMNQREFPIENIYILQKKIIEKPTFIYVFDRKIFVIYIFPYSGVGLGRRFVIGTHGVEGTVGN